MLIADQVATSERGMVKGTRAAVDLANRESGV